MMIKRHYEPEFGINEYLDETNIEKIKIQEEDSDGEQNEDYEVARYNQSDENPNSQRSYEKDYSRKNNGIKIVENQDASDTQKNGNLNGNIPNGSKQKVQEDDYDEDQDYQISDDDSDEHKYEDEVENDARETITSRHTLTRAIVRDR